MGRFLSNSKSISENINGNERREERTNNIKALKRDNFIIFTSTEICGNAVNVDNNDTVNDIRRPDKA